jgi:hypothetical protein
MAGEGLIDAQRQSAVRHELRSSDTSGKVPSNSTAHLECCEAATALPEGPLDLARSLAKRVR